MTLLLKKRVLLSSLCLLVKLCIYRYLITCGSDGDVRIYDGFDDDDPESFRAGENVTAVTYKVLYILLDNCLGHSYI